jgi:hypothetical protein
MDFDKNLVKLIKIHWSIVDTLSGGDSPFETFNCVIGRMGCLHCLLSELQRRRNTGGYKPKRFITSRSAVPIAIAVPVRNGHPERR